VEKLSKILDDLIGNDIYETMLDKPYEYENIYDRRFILSDLNISSRVLNHWKEYGLLPDERIKEDTQNKIGVVKNDLLSKKRNRFDFFELIYLYILQDLRKFGFSLKKMKTVKEALLFSPDFLSEIKEISESDILSIKKAGFDIGATHKLYKNIEIIKNAELIPDVILNASILSHAILAIIVFKLDLKLVITIEGQVSFDLTNSVGQVGKTIYNSQPHIVLPLYNYLYHFLSNKKYKKFYVMYKLLNDQELLILDQVRNGLYKEIKIIMKNGDTIRMELTEKVKVENATRVQEMLLKGKYQNLNIISELGEVSYSTRTTKIKLK